MQSKLRPSRKISDISSIGSIEIFELAKDIEEGLANKSIDDMDDVIEDDVRSETASSGSIRRLNALENLLRQQIASKEASSSGVGGVEDPSISRSKSLRSSRERLDVEPKESSIRRHASRDFQGQSSKDELKDQRVKYVPYQTQSSDVLPQSWKSSGFVDESSREQSYASEPELANLVNSVRSNDLDTRRTGTRLSSSTEFTETKRCSTGSVRSRSADTSGRRNLPDEVADVVEESFNRSGKQYVMPTSLSGMDYNAKVAVSKSTSGISSPLHRSSPKIENEAALRDRNSPADMRDPLDVRMSDKNRNFDNSSDRPLPSGGAFPSSGLKAPLVTGRTIPVGMTQSHPTTSQLPLKDVVPNSSHRVSKFFL